MNRPSPGQAAALGATSIAAAAIAVGVAQIELNGQTQPHIWSNAWLVAALALAGVGLVVALVFFVMSMFDRERVLPATERQPGQHDSNPEGADQVRPSGETDQANAEATPAHQAGAQKTDVALHAEQLLDGLNLGEHDEAERRLNRLFMHLSRDQQQAIVQEIIRVATTTKDKDDSCKWVACALLQAADRLDPMLIKIDDVETLAASADFSLRSCAADLMWQWAESAPGRVPIALLGKLAQPSTEDWYVHSPARAAAKQLLLRRAAARAIFDRMARSRDRNDRDYAVSDLLDVARTEPRAVPVDLARKLARDEDKSVATQAAELVRAVGGIGDAERARYYSSFAM